MMTALGSWLFASIWKGTLLVAFALVIHRVARSFIPPRWLFALLLLAILRLLLPVAPASPFSVFNLFAREEVATSRLPILTGAPALPANPERVLRRMPSPESSPAPWIPALVTVWLAGVAVALTRTARQMLRFRRQLSDRAAADHGDIRALIDDCRTRLGVRRPIGVFMTAAVVTPSLHGWLRPALLLPHGFLDSFTTEQVRYVVLHELAHLRRSDVLVNWLATGAQILHWFNPLVRLAVARLAEERELACDELALAAVRPGERAAYGSTVLEIVDRLRTGPMIPALVGMTATPQQLKRRIVMIASFRTQSRYSLLFAVLLVAAGLVTLTDATAGEQHQHQMKKSWQEKMSLAAQAVAQSLEPTMNLELTSASLEDVLHAISNATGASIKVADDAYTDEIRNSRITLKAVSIPAHLLLYETASSIGLGVKFTDAGVEVVDVPQDLGGVRMQFIEKNTDGAPGTTQQVRVIVMHEGDEKPEHAAAAMAHQGMKLRIVKHEPGMKHENVEVTAEKTAEGSVRNVKFRGAEGTPEGSLRLEVKR